MRLLQKIILDSIGEYLPGLDKEQLRVDVLNGRCSLENVDCTPGPVLAFADFPFRLVAGHVGSLELKVPWKSLSNSPVRVCAKNVSLRFEEVPFPSRIDEVRAAVKTAKRRTKLRSIADGEKRASMISRLLHKLLPLILHHVEVDFAEVSISVTLVAGFHVSLQFDRIATSENTSTTANSHHQQTSSDLSKLLQVSNVAIDVFKRCSEEVEAENGSVVTMDCLSGFWRKERVFSIPKFDVCLSFDGGALAVIFDIPCAVVLTLPVILVDLLLSLKKSCSRWKVVQCPSIVHSRPKLRPAQDPRAWFRYAKQEALCSKQGTGLKALCDEYKSLHVRRLTASHQLQPAEDDRITELEEKLDVGTILALRNQANKEILVDGAATFATGDLLSRLLFGSQLTDEREAIALEIRQSLESLERFSQEFGSGDNVTSSADSRLVGNSWAKAIVTIRVQRFEIGIVQANSTLLLSVADVKGWAELDSSLSNCAGVLIFDDATLANGNTLLLQRTYPGAIGTGILHQWQPTSCTAPPLSGDAICTLQIRKMPLDRNVTISASVAALSLDLDVPSFAPLVSYVNYARNEILSAHSSRVPDTSSREENVGASSSKIIRSTIFHVDFAGGTALMTAPDVNPKVPSLRKKVVCIEVRRTVVDVEMQNGIRAANISTRLGFKGGIYLNPNQSIPPDELEWQIVDEIPLSISYKRKSLLLDVGELKVHLTNGNVEIWTSMLAFLKKQLKIWNTADEHRWRVRGHVGVKEQPRADNAVMVLPRILIEVTAITVYLEAEDTTQASYVTLKKISGVLKNENGLRISARDFILGEKNSRAAVQIYPTTADEHGLILEYSAERDCSNGSGADAISDCTSRIHVQCGNAGVLASPNSVSRILDVVFMYGKRFWEAVQPPLNSNMGVSATGRVEQAVVACLGFSVCVNVLSLEIATGDVRTLLRAERCFYRLAAGKHSGAFQVMEVLDLSNKSGNYSRAVESVKQESANAENGNSVEFTVKTEETVIRLSGLDVVFLRSFVYELYGVITDLIGAIQKFVQNVQIVSIDSWSGAALHQAETGIVSESDSSEVPCMEESKETMGWKIILHCEFLKITAPVQKSLLGALRISVPEAMMTFMEGSQVATFRRVSLLTRPSRASPHASLAGSSQSPVLREWNVLLRSLDLDLNHNQKSFYQDTFEELEGPNKSRSQWSFEVLSQASILLAPSQIFLIKGVISQLFPQVPETITISESSLDAQNKRAGPTDKNSLEDRESISDDDVSVHPVCDHLLIDVGTEIISVDLLEEGEHGSVVATIANITCGPCWFTMESIRETNGSSNSTRVTRKNLDIHSVWVEDHRRGVPRHRELVFAVRAITDLPQVLFKRKDSESSSCSVHIESLSRFENDESKVSSKLQISDPLICFCPGLISSLTNFFSDSISVGEMDNDGSTASSGSIVDDEEDEHVTHVQRDNTVGVVSTVAQREDRTGGTVVLKLSIVVSQPTLFIPFQSVLKEMYGLKLTSSGVKASLLLGKDGCILRESSMRSRNIVVSMPQHGDTSCRNANTMFNAEISSNFRGDDDELHVDLLHSPFGFETPSEYASAFNRGRRPHSLYMWTKMTDYPALSAIVSGVTAKLPTALDDCWSLSVAGVSIDTDYRALLDFTSLFEYLALAPESFGSQPQSSAPVDLSVRNISVHIVTRLNAEIGEEGAQIFHLRLRGGLRLRLSRDLAFISSRIRVSADVFNENTGIRDQLLAPCDMKVKIDTVSSRLSITVPMSIQVTVSPLTVRLVACVALLTSSHLQKRRELLKPESLPTPGVIEDDRKMDGTEVFINVRGVLMSLVSEEPRAQLMRFVFRDIRACSMWVTDEFSWGSLELEVGDILLEDVISWHMFGSDELGNDRIEWKTMFSGANDLAKTGFPSDVPKILPGESSPSDSRRPILQPGSFEHERQQMSLPFPIEDLSIDDSPAQLTSGQKVPFLSVLGKWQYPAKHIAVQIALSALDLRLNSAILPSLLEWITSISTAMEEVVLAYEAANQVAESEYTRDKYYASDPISIDNFVIEPITIRIATKAPPRPVEQSAFNRLLDWLFGSDSMSGLTLETTRISFGGDFKDLGCLLGRLRTEYFNGLLSRYMMTQLFMQVPTLSTLTRVGASTVLRQTRLHIPESLMGTSSAAKELTGPAFGLATALIEDVRSIAGQGSGINGRLQLTQAGRVITRVQTFQDDASDEVPRTLDLTLRNEHRYLCTGS